MIQDENQQSKKNGEDENASDVNSHTESQNRFDRGTAIDVFATKDEQASIAKHTSNDLANNDGSVLGTLDKVFHNVPGHGQDDQNTGSNRADYYESKNSGKADDEEETDSLKNQQKE